MTKSAVISLSGGMDSSSLLAHLLATREYRHIYCFAFNYGQRHNIELTRAKELVEFLKSENHPVSFEVLDLRSVFSASVSALNNPEIEVPKEAYRDENLTTTVVENRNVIFSAIIYARALMVSKANKENVDIALGVHAADAHNGYPDTTEESVNLSKILYKISNYGSEKIRYISPYLTFNKTQVLMDGLDSIAGIGIPPSEYYSMTSSCYDPTVDGKSCGKCATCLERLQAFEYCGYPDPVTYA